jgi:hypothetical protein
MFKWLDRMLRPKPTPEEIAMGSYVRSFAYLAHGLAEASRTDTAQKQPNATDCNVNETPPNGA